MEAAVLPGMIRSIPAAETIAFVVLGPVGFPNHVRPSSRSRRSQPMRKNAMRSWTAVLFGFMIAATATAMAADRSAKEILKELDAIKMRRMSRPGAPSPVTCSPFSGR
jgi:hypothetical protein